MIRMEFDATPAVQFLDGLFREQVPFAMSRALNQTAKDIRAAEQAELSANFILRQPRFILDSVRIPKFANKADSPMEVMIEIGDKASFLRKFQAPGVKTALSPDFPIAIPTSAIRASKSALPPRELYPKNLRLVPRKGVTGILPAKRHVTRRGVVQLKGKRRTFVLDPKEHRGVSRWGVYQRTGPGKQDIRLIWIYRSSVPIPKRLDFHPVAQRVAAQNWVPNFAKAYAEAVRTAR